MQYRSIVQYIIKNFKYIDFNKPMKTYIAKRYLSATNVRNNKKHEIRTFLQCFVSIYLSLYTQFHHLICV